MCWIINPAYYTHQTGPRLASAGPLLYNINLIKKKAISFFRLPRDHKNKYKQRMHLLYCLQGLRPPTTTSEIALKACEYTYKHLGPHAATAEGRCTHLKLWNTYYVPWEWPLFALGMLHCNALRMLHRVTILYYVKAGYKKPASCNTS